MHFEHSLGRCPTAAHLSVIILICPFMPSNTLRGTLYILRVAQTELWLIAYRKTEIYTTPKFRFIVMIDRDV